MTLEAEEIQIEQHPWEPFAPKDARVLFLGTFPPGNHRWSMDFYYPNRTNDFWYMMGLIFLKDKHALYDKAQKSFRLEEIKALLTDKHIALSDTAREVRRLKGNASDKFLEIVTPLPLYSLLETMPDCHTVVTTGEKAAGVIAELTHTAVPKMGEMIMGPEGLEIWRMPSTSRAFPMALEQKAAFYRSLFQHVQIL